MVGSLAGWGPEIAKKGAWRVAKMFLELYDEPSRLLQESSVWWGHETPDVPNAMIDLPALTRRTLLKTFTCMPLPPRPVWMLTKLSYKVLTVAGWKTD